MDSNYVLIVDDNKDARDILTKILTSAGIQTEAAVNGEEALTRIDTTPPALILLDLMMPTMSGFEMLSRLRNDPSKRHIPVFVISAYLGAGGDDILNLPGVTRVIPKASFRIPDLLSAVTGIINNHSVTSVKAA